MPDRTGLQDSECANALQRNRTKLAALAASLGVAPASPRTDIPVLPCRGFDIIDLLLAIVARLP